jgi:hypothetical protein
MESPTAAHLSEASTHALHTLSAQIAFALAADPPAAAAFPEIPEHVQVKLLDCMSQSHDGVTAVHGLQLDVDQIGPTRNAGLKCPPIAPVNGPRRCC